MTHARKFSLFYITLCLSLLVCSCNESQATPTVNPEEQIDYSPMVSATGMVVPYQQAALSMLSSGTVEEIMVEEGEFVTKGEILLRLKGSEELFAAVSAAQLELTSAQIAYDELYKDAELNRSNAQLTLAIAEDAFDKASDRRRSKEYKVGDQEDIDIAYARYMLAEQIVKDREKEWEENAAWRREDDLIRLDVLTRLAAARDERDEALREYNYLNSLPDEIERSKAEGELEVARQQLEEARADWEKVKATGLDPHDVELAEKRFQNAKAQLASSQEQLANIELSSPFDGTISRIDIHANEWVEIGQLVMLLADLQHLRVETTDLNEIDVARVNIGDTAIVTFDAIPDATISGSVEFIADKSEGSGVNYKVYIALDETPEKVRWGMTAFVDIDVEE